MKSVQKESQFGICIHHEGCEDLELFKMYHILHDETVAQDGYIRVFDESGEDYLYPKNFFILLELPTETEDRLSAVYQHVLTRMSAGEGEHVRTS